MERISYRDALRAKGVKPLPPYNQLRTSKGNGDLEQVPVAAANKFVEHKGLTDTPHTPKLHIVEAA